MLIALNTNIVIQLNFCTGPEYLKKRLLQEVVEGTENADTVMHEPLLAEEEPLPTPPESPLMNELDSLMPGSSPGRTPSPSPGIIIREEPKLLSPGSWNGDKTSKDGGTKGNSKPNSRPSSRPTTPSASAPAPALVAPEDGVAPSSRGPSRTPSRQSNKNEQGSDLEIKPLQKFDSKVKAPDVSVAAASPVKNSLISPDEEEAPRPTSKVPSKPVTPDPKPTEIKPDRAPSVHERVPSATENKVEISRPPSKAETKPLPKRQPSPAPTPKPARIVEPKPVTNQVEVKGVVAKPAQKVEPKAEARLKAIASVPTTESLELEVTGHTHSQ